MNHARSYGLAAGSALITALVFLRCLGCDFLAFDDAKHLTANPFVHGLTAANLGWMLTASHMGHYHPLTWLSYALDYELWGLSPAGFHATGWLLHALNASLLFAIARRLLASGLPGAPARRLDLGALAAALLFALHPLRVESVAWVSERRDTLSGLFYLGAVYAYLRQAAARASRPRRRWRLGLLILAAAALLSKAVAVTLPLALMTLDVYPLRRWPGPARRRLLRSAADKWPLFALSAAAGLLAVRMALGLPGFASWERLGLWPRLLVAAHAPGFYLLKTAIPAGLSPLYELPPAAELASARVLACVAVAALATAATFAARRRLPSAAASWLAFLLLLAPMSGLVQNGPQLAADRYTYLPGAALAVAAGAGVAAVPLAAGRAMAAGAIAALSGLTYRQIGFWKDTQSLWTRALAVDPGSLAALNNLGLVLLGQGRDAEAIERFARAVELAPGFAPAHLNLAVALDRQGRQEEALEHLRIAAALRPDKPVARRNLALMLRRLGRHAEAAAVEAAGAPAR